MINRISKTPTVSIEQIISAYEATGSVWRAGDLLGMAGQTVHKKLKRAGYRCKHSNFSKEEIAQIKEAYSGNKLSGDIGLKELAVRMNKSCEKNLSRKARELGLTVKGRKRNKKSCEEMSARAKIWLQKNPHPKGMLGKKHSEETLKTLSICSSRNYKNLSAEKKRSKIFSALKTKKENGTLIPHRHKTTWKQGWHEIGGKRMFMRSSWEPKYAEILEKRKKLGIITEWEYEPETFWFEKVKSGTRCYTPDFRVTWPDGVIEYHEIKGWMDPVSKTKLKRMKKYHPNIKIILIDAKAYKNLMKAGV